MPEDKAPVTKDILDGEIEPINGLLNQLGAMPVKRAILKFSATIFCPPLGSILTLADDLAVIALQKNKARKIGNIKVFIDEISKGDDFPKELLDDDKFLFYTELTAKAVGNTIHKQKVRWFARLLLSATRDIKTESDYEYFLNILNELSYRELGILVTLEKYEKKHPVLEEETPSDRVSGYWDSFMEEALATFSLKKEEFDWIMVRIARSGLYIYFAGYWDGGTSGRGKLTPNYYRFSEVIKLNNGDL